jgi:polar amino acid transport system substrate-binding protein
VAVSFLGESEMAVIPKNRLLANCVAAVSLFLSSSLAFGGDDLTIMTEDYPPLNYVEHEKPRGPAVDIVKAIMDELGIGSDIEVFPWARGYRFLETRKNSALFSTTRSKSRDGLFKWVGPIAEKKIGLFAKRGRSPKPKTLEDAKGSLIGVQRGGVGMQYLQDRGFKNFDASTTPIANLKKLMAGRNDLWFASNATVAGNCKRLDIDVDELELVLVLENTFMYIAFNKDTPDDIIDRWQGTYDGLVKKGAVKKIFQNHGLESLYPAFR